MADQPITPSDEELRSLMGARTRKDAGPHMPDPEPEVLQRAQRILDEAKAGVAQSTVTTGDGDERQVRAGQALFDPEVDNDDKVAFMAHVLGGKSFERTYSFLDGQIKITFESIMAAKDMMLAELVRYEETKGYAQEHDRKSRYAAYLRAASLKSIQFDTDPPIRYNIFADSGKFTDHRNAYQEWMSQLTRVQYQLIKEAHRDFQGRLQKLMSKVDDPVFWRTPLSRS